MAATTLKSSPLTFLTARMRAAADGGEAALPAMINQAVSFLRDEEDGPARAGRISELAYTLSEVLESCQDKAVIKGALKTLLGLGVTGEILANSYVSEKSSTPEQMSLSLAALSPKEQLIVLNRFFMVPRTVEPQVLELATERVKEIAGQDPEEVLLFLEYLAGQGRSPAYSVQWELLRGQFGVWLDELLKLKLAPEQAAYLVRTAGLLQSPKIAEALARLIEDGDSEAALLVVQSAVRSSKVSREIPEKIIRRFLKHPDFKLRRAAAAAMIEIGYPASPKALGLILQKRQKDKAGLLPLAMMLWGSDFRKLVELLPAESRAADLWSLTLLAAEHDNRSFEYVVSDLPEKGTSAITKALPELKKLAGEYKDAGPRPAFVLPKYARRPPEEEQQGIFGKVRRKVKEMTGKDEGPGSGARALAQMEPEGKMGRYMVANADLAGIELKRNFFKNTSFNTLGLGAARISECRFNSCRMASVDFRGADLESAVFMDCIFEHCVFTGARIASATFSRCTFKGCYFGESRFIKPGVVDCLFMECDFWGSSWSGSMLSSCLFRASSFAWAGVSGSNFKGVAWRDCVFERTFFASSNFYGSSFQAGEFAGSIFSNVKADDPELGEARRIALNDCFLKSVCKSAAPPPGLDGDQGVQAMLHVLDRWLFERDACRREEAVLAQNRRRMLWAISKWGEQAAEFVKLLPLMLDSGSPVPGGKASPPACRLPGYFPDYHALRLAEKYLGKNPASAQKEGGVSVEGLYSIGSVGTIAQNRNSDLDLWLCYEPGTLEGENLKAVKAGIADIEEWAAKVFGLEVHFFVMDMQNVRDNYFGFSDRESAGSAQARLLKEEFYRTVVLMAGKKPVWWYAPPNSTIEQYGLVQKRLMRSPNFGAGALVDLGHLDKVPKEEFFGASLWQIVKALKRPFKSVMKFAVLDRYFASEEAGSLFCDRIKNNLLWGARGLWDVDAYGVLFREVYEFYKRAGNKEAMDLMLRAFRQKTGFKLEGRTKGRPFEMTGASFMEYFFPVSDSPVERDIAPAMSAVMAGEKRSGFADLVVTGRKVSRFMFSTYESVYDKLAAENLETQVSREDMTKLFRKIFAGFKQKKGKIMLVPFVDQTRGLYSTLDIQCPVKPGDKSAWTVRGRRIGRYETEQEALEEMVRYQHPVCLAAWLVANGIYDPKIPIRGNLQKPLSLPDLTELLEALREFFPHDGTFNTDIEENLNDERAVKVFTVVNLMSLREETAIREAQVVFSTNWGEMFCLTNPSGLDQLRNDPMAFVRANAPYSAGRDVETMFHIPHKARCQRIIMP